MSVKYNIGILQWWIDEEMRNKAEVSFWIKLCNNNEVIILSPILLPMLQFLYSDVFWQNIPRQMCTQWVCWLFNLQYFSPIFRVLCYTSGLLGRILVSQTQVQRQHRNSFVAWRWCIIDVPCCDFSSVITTIVRQWYSRNWVGM